MSVIHLLLPIALMLGGGFLAGFVWMAKNGQFEDLETPAHRLLLEEFEAAGPKEREKGKVI